MKGSKHVRKLTALVLAFMIVLTGCAESRGGGSGAGNLADKVENLPAGIAEKDPVKLMVVRKIGAMIIRRNSWQARSRKARLSGLR